MRNVSSARIAIAGAALMALLVAGCGSAEDSSSSTSESTSEATSEATSASESPSQAGTPEATADGECPSTTEVTVTSTNGGYPGGIDWATTYAVAERPYAGLGGDGRAVKVYISTAQRPLAELTDRHTELAPDEGFLELTFTNGEQDALGGDYATSVETGAPNRLDLGVHVTNGTTVQLDSNLATGEAQLTESGGQVCGSFTIADKWTSAGGTFVAAVETG